MESPHISSKNNREQDSKLNSPISNGKPNQVGSVILYGIPIVSLVIENQERLCLAQISNTLLKQFSYNEIHNRRVALGITCVQCTPVQLEILRRAGAMPVSSRRCGMITRREAERLCKSFLGDNAPPRLPDDFAFSVHHECAWGCRGAFLPSRYNSSRAKCIKCTYCGLFFSPNKFIFHSHRMGGPTDKYIQPDAANFNSWRRHMKLSGTPPDEIIHAWEDVKAMFNGGTRKRLLSTSSSTPSSRAPSSKQAKTSPTNATTFTVPSSPVIPAPARVPPFPELPLPISRSLVMDYMWHNHQSKQFSFPPYTAALPWLKRSNSSGGPLLFPPESTLLGFHSGLEKSPMSAAYHHQSAFRPVQSMLLHQRSASRVEEAETTATNKSELSDEDDDEVDIETTDDKSIIIGTVQSGSESPSSSRWSPKQETLNQNDIQTSPAILTDLRGSSSSLAHSPLNLSPKSDISMGGSVANNGSTGSIITPNHPVTHPASLMMADRLWSISRITQQMSPTIERTISPHQQFLYHPQEPILNRNRDHSTHNYSSRSNSPISVKALDCTACQNVVCNNHQTIENNTKLPT